VRDDLAVLRPAPRDAYAAHEIDLVVGKTISSPLVAGEDIRPEHLA